jgi:hypothetical protein
MPGKGIFFSISDEENAAFHAALQRHLKRKIKRGDLTAAGAEALRLWIEKYDNA